MWVFSSMCCVQRIVSCLLSSQLSSEIDAYDAKFNDSAMGQGIKDYKKTSLAPSVALFQQFVEDLSTEWKGKLLEISGMC